MIKTPLCDLLNIEFPILQGGMAWISDAQLAAAVSNAGGLGIISSMNADENWLRSEIKKAKSLTDKPFGVNVMLMNPHVDKIAQVLIDEKVPVVTTGAGNPGKFMKLWIEAGIKLRSAADFEVTISGGYSFDRFFFEGENYDDDRTDNRVDVTDGPFVSVRARIKL